MASRSSVIGALGLGKQTAKGALASTFHWIPATSLNLNAQQQTQTYAPEIGGSHFLRGSYKTGVSAGGDIGIQVRPNSIGYLLHMLCGQVTTNTNSAAPTVADPSAAPVLTASAGSTSLPAGTYTVGYTLTNVTGETRLSPTATVTLTAGEEITIGAITLGSATGVKYYMSIETGSTDLGFAGTGTGTGDTVTQLGNGLQPPPAANSTGGTGDGSYTHVFTPFQASASADLPWYSAVKDVAKLYWEQFVDCKLSSLRFDVSKQSLVTATASMFGITPQEVDGSAFVETMDTTTVFQSCIATVNLVDESGQISLTSNDVKPERLSFDFGNQLSQDEYTVGSYVPADITLLQRTANISYDVVIRDPDLRRAVYQNGAAPLGGAGSVADWSPKLFRGSLTLDLTTTDKIGLSNNVYELKIVIPGLDFLMMPVQLSGAQLIRANLSAQVTLGTTGTDTYSFILTNGVASY